MELLPTDLLAEILRRLPAHGLATARCVHSSWCAVIDSHRLIQHLTLPLAGIFITFHDHDLSELLARPTPPSACTVSGKFHQYMPTTFPAPVADHCNGLLLLGCAYVVNPATRQWATLPLVLPGVPFNREGFPLYSYIVFDPSVSPHYEVIIVPHLPNKEVSNTRVDAWEWPPSSMIMRVFSSATATNRWEDRSFVRHGEALGTIADVKVPCSCEQQYGVYWRGNLYVHHNFIMRISLSSGKYQAIKPPHGMYTNGFQERRLGKSDKGVYIASMASTGRQLQVWILDESCAHAKWVLKYEADLMHILSHRSYNSEARGSWVMEDVNYHFYNHRIPDYSGPAPPEDRFEWDSDEDDALDTKDTIEGRYNKHISFLGFHPHKEVLFLSESMRRGLAYHLNTSKLQDLGNIYPTRYDCFADPHELLLYSYPYTPCWTSEFPSNN